MMGMEFETLRFRHELVSSVPELIYEANLEWYYDYSEQFPKFTFSYFYLRHPVYKLKPSL